MSFNRPARFTMCERRTSAGCSPSGMIGMSNGFTCDSEVSEMLKKLPPKPSARRWYSFSGSMTRMSTPIIS